MPRRAPRICRGPGCGRAVQGGGYCDACKKPAAPGPSEAEKAYDDRRGSAHARGYGRAWRRLRKVILDLEPLCRPCKKAGRRSAAVEVDHLVPLRDGGTNDDSNLQPICRKCHAEKTAQDVARRQA